MFFLFWCPGNKPFQSVLMWSNLGQSLCAGMCVPCHVEESLCSIFLASSVGNWHSVFQNKHYVINHPTCSRAISGVYSHVHVARGCTIMYTFVFIQLYVHVVYTWRALNAWECRCVSPDVWLGKDGHWAVVFVPQSTGSDYKIDGSSSSAGDSVSALIYKVPVQLCTAHNMLIVLCVHVYVLSGPCQPCPNMYT